MPVGLDQVGAARGFVERAMEAGLRARVDVDGSLGARVRDAVRARIPYAAVIGPKERDEDLVSLRLRDGRALAPMPADAALRVIGDVAAHRGHELLPDRGLER
jgi:threonyl-tRNA synthetase